MNTIDTTVFNDLRATAGADFVTELVNTFLEEAPVMLADLRSARTAADVERYRRVAHSLKSNGNTFGAKDFAAQARAIELGGLAADPARDFENIAALEAAYNQAAAALKALTHG
jgi:HPt (histidine-containing phosphotransfer) domain-containing protein